jgi:hypothetical protein
MGMRHEQPESSMSEGEGTRARHFFGGIRDSVGEALRTVRQDPAMERSETRRAALKLLAYIAAALVILNALIHAPRRR